MFRNVPAIKIKYLSKMNCRYFHYQNGFGDQNDVLRFGTIKSNFWRYAFCDFRATKLAFMAIKMFVCDLLRSRLKFGRSNIFYSTFGDQNRISGDQNVLFFDLLFLFDCFYFWHRNSMPATWFWLSGLGIM